MKILVALCFLAFSSVAGAQGLSSAGTEYWLGFMPNYIDPADKINLFVASETTNYVKVEIFGLNGEIAQTKSFALDAQQAITVPLTPGQVETREREQPVYRAIKVTSSAPCAVYGYSDNSLTTDGYLGLPLEMLGTKYYCLSYYDDAYSPGFDHLGGEFLIVAPYDSTKVTIRTTAKTALDDGGVTIGHNAGDTWTVTLQAGQTYLVQTTGWGYGTDDLTGSYVESSKPVAFLTGHQRASIELDASNNSKDHLIEMLPPVETWATEYYMSPQGRPKCGDYVRVLSAEDANIVSVNGSQRQLNAGEMFDVSLVTAPTLFRSTNGKRFIVMAYSYTQNFNGDPAVGDPFTITLSGKQNMQKRMIFRTPSNSGGPSFIHYGTIISTQSGLSAIRLKSSDNPAQPLSSYGATGPFPIPGSNYLATPNSIDG